MPVGTNATSLVGSRLNFKKNQRRVVRRGAEAADAESFALELLHARHHFRPGKGALIVRIFYRADEHDVVAL